MQDNKVLIIFLVLISVFGVTALAAPDLVGSFVVVVAVSTLVLAVLRRNPDDAAFLTKIFLVGVTLRLAFGLVVYYLDLRDFFGADAVTYDGRGALLVNYWAGKVPESSNELFRATDVSSPGWGMTYLVAAIYSITGRNFLAAQSFCGIIGAATAPLVYLCARAVYSNEQVARYAAIGVAVFPSFIIWSGQLMKDGLIVFLLVLVMLMVMKLQERFNYAAIVVLVLSLGGIISLRFYIFYMVAVAVAGSFILGTASNVQSTFRRIAVLVVAGIALTYLGVLRSATTDISVFTNLDQVQSSRSDLARSAKSGFGEDIDVSTPTGAISAIPVGLVYLMLAPFPWQMGSLRQSITLPEVLVWWSLLPLLGWGLWYTVRHRLRAAFPIVMFSLMLTLAYSIFQGNVGTAYRQRTQIQVFLFMFIAVGIVLIKERRENKRLMRRHRMPGGD